MFNTETGILDGSFLAFCDDMEPVGFRRKVVHLKVMISFVEYISEAYTCVLKIWQKTEYFNRFKLFHYFMMFLYIFKS